MPPKPKVTKDEIVQAALEVVSQKGVEALTAKELGDALGSSARPIFTVFRSMKEVQDEVRAAAMRRFERFAAQTLPDMPLFKQVGMRMVLFGAKEPKLYQRCVRRAGFHSGDLYPVAPQRARPDRGRVFSGLGDRRDLHVWDRRPVRDRHVPVLRAAAR